MTNTQFNNPQIKSIKGSIVILDGQYKYKYNAAFTLSDQAKGIVIRANENSAHLIAWGNLSTIKIGNVVKELPSFDEVNVYENFFGSVVSIDGVIIHNKDNNYEKGNFVAKGNIKPKDIQIFHRKKLDEPLQTGIFAIDTMIPIGKGQRQLIIGNHQTGKTSIALSAIIRNKDSNLKTIYISIGQKRDAISQIYHDLEKLGAVKNTILLYPNSKSSSELYLAPYIGMAMAEAIAYQGNDVLVIIDDLTKHASAYREISLLTGRFVGREAYPGDMFYSHSQILERAGKFNEKYKNGTISCLPIVETINEDVSNLIPSNVISITDGQIFTNQKLFDKGVRPSIDIALSVSRTGTSVQNLMIRLASRELNKIYSKYLEYKKMEEMSFDLPKKIDMIIANGQKIEEIMNQPEFDVYDEMYIVILAQLIEWNWVAKVKKIHRFVKIFMKFLDNDISAKKIMKRATKEGFTQENKKILRYLFFPIVKEYFKRTNNLKNIVNQQTYAKMTKNEMNYYFEGVTWKA